MVERGVKKQIYIGRIIVSLIIATFLFIGVFSFGYLVAFENYKSMATKQDIYLNSLLELEVQKDLIKSSCYDFNLASFSEDLNNMGAIMGQLEAQLGKENPEVLEQKKVFTILQVQHYLLIEERNKECGNNNPTVLFIYSNQKEYIDEAERIGYIISNLKNNRPEVMVYSLDFDLDSELIKIIKTINNITEPNSVIINGRILTGLKNVNELKEILDNPDFNSLNNTKIINLN